MTKPAFRFRDLTDPIVLEEISRELARQQPGLERALAELEKAKHVSRRVLDAEVTI